MDSRNLAWRHAVPFVLLAWALAAAVTVIPEGAFFSGDGGLKALHARQFAEGIFATDLHLPAPAWVEAEWALGAYPFDPPFVVESQGRRMPGFPPWFALLTAPLLALFGWRGLFAIPAASVLWIALEVDAHLRRRVPRVPRWLGLAMLLSGTPLALYGVTFWEHAPACALSAAGLLRLARTDVPERAHAFGWGLVMGLAGWLRPEHFVLAAVSLLAFRPLLREAPPGPDGTGAPTATRRRLDRFDAALLGVLAALAAWAVANLLLFGTPTGVHGTQVTGIEGPGRWWMIRTVAASLLPLPFLHSPVMTVACVLAVLTFVPTVRRRCPETASFAAIALFFPLTACLVLPNDGGRQIGPRYLLGAMVPAALAAAQWFDRASGLPVRLGLPIRATVLLAVIAGVAVTSMSAVRLASDYAERVAPVLETVRADGDRPIVVDLDWTALEIAHVADRRPMLRVRDAAALDRVQASMKANGVPGFLYVAMKVGDFDARTAPVRDEATSGLACARVRESAALVAWECRLARQAGDGARDP